MACWESFDSRPEPLVSQCHLSTHSLLRRLDLSRNCLYLWFFFDSQGFGSSLFDNLWDLGRRLVRKGEFDKYLTRPINPLFHILVETFQIDALGELLVGGILLGTTVTSIAWTLPKFLTFPSLYSFCDLDLYFLENCYSQHRFLDQAVRCHDLHFLYV